MALFRDADEKTSATIICAGIVAHALISRGNASTTEGNTKDRIISASFDFAEKFLAELERRYGQ